MLISFETRLNDALSLTEYGYYLPILVLTVLFPVAQIVIFVPPVILKLTDPGGAPTCCGLRGGIPGPLPPGPLAPGSIVLLFFYEE